MSLASTWNYDKAIVEFKKIAGDPISEKYTPYGIPYYALIAAMVQGSRKQVKDSCFEFEISNGKLSKAWGPSIYPGSKMNLAMQPRPTFRAWREYMELVAPLVAKLYPSAKTDFDAVVVATQNLVIKYDGVADAMGYEAISAAIATTPQNAFPCLKNERLSIRPGMLQLNLEHKTGGVEITVLLKELLAKQPATAIMARFAVDVQAELDEALNFMAVRKTAFEAYAATLIGSLTGGQAAQSEAAFKQDEAALEAALDAFYAKHCKGPIDMLKNANQLQQVI